MPWVLDASIAGAWFFVEERTVRTELLLQRLKMDEAVVTAAFPLEVANLLLVGVRRGRLAVADLHRYASMLAQANILIDRPPLSLTMSDVQNLATKHHLSAYDAAYLELALRHQLPLATNDDLLIAAARAENIPLL